VKLKISNASSLSPSLRPEILGVTNSGGVVMVLLLLGVEA